MIEPLLGERKKDREKEKKGEKQLFVFEKTVRSVTANLSLYYTYGLTFQAARPKALLA